VSVNTQPPEITRPQSKRVNRRFVDHDVFVRTFGINPESSSCRVVGANQAVKDKLVLLGGLKVSTPRNLVR
jgi:hypothetical protein